MTFVVIDFETGGTITPHENIDCILASNGLEDQLKIYYDPPLQFAAIAYGREFREIETLELKLHADIDSCDPEALAICHYDAETWKNYAIQPKEAALIIKAFLGEHSIEMKHDRGPFRAARLIGHNVEFDIAHLRKLYEWEWCNAAFWSGRHTGYIDTQEMAKLYGIMRGKQFRSLRLEDVYRELFDETYNAHDALADCRATARIAKNIMFSMRQAWEWSMCDSQDYMPDTEEQGR